MSARVSIFGKYPHYLKHKKLGDLAIVLVRNESGEQNRIHPHNFLIYSFVKLVKTMARFYTVDRSGSLSIGAEVRCDSDFNGAKFFPIQDHFTRQDLEALTQHLFPGGLTYHGKKYLLDECLVISTPQGPAPYVPHIPMIELVLELVRRVYFPEKPSRMTALFAWATLQEAVEFQKEHGGGSIYEVETESFFRGDMKLLLLGGSGIGAVLFAMKYWQGEHSPIPRWEYLLVPPVRVVG